MQENEATPGSGHEPEFKFSRFFRVKRGLIAGAVGFCVILVTDGQNTSGVQWLRMATFTAPWLIWANADGLIKAWASWRAVGIALGGWLTTILFSMPFVAAYALLRSLGR